MKRTNTGQRLIALLLTLSMTLGMLSATGWAAEIEPEDTPDVESVQQTEEAEIQEPEEAAPAEEPVTEEPEKAAPAEEPVTEEPEEPTEGQSVTEEVLEEESEGETVTEAPKMSEMSGPFVPSTTWVSDQTISATQTINGLAVNSNMTLTISEGVTLTINGGIHLDSYTLTVEGGGKLVVNGAGGEEGDGYGVPGTNAPHAAVMGANGTLVVNGAEVEIHGGRGGDGGWGEDGYDGDDGSDGGAGGKGAAGVEGSVLVNSGILHCWGGDGGDGGWGGNGGYGGYGYEAQDPGNGANGANGGGGEVAICGSLTVGDGYAYVYGGNGGSGGLAGDGGDHVIYDDAEGYAYADWMAESGNWGDEGAPAIAVAGTVTNDIPGKNRDDGSTIAASSSDTYTAQCLQFSWLVNLTAGANTTMTAGEAFQLIHTGDPIAAVTFTANNNDSDDGYFFTAFNDIGVNGLTMSRVDEATVTISGTPTDDVTYTARAATHKRTVTLTGGDNAVVTPEGKTTQRGLTGAMETVTYTANSGYYFAPFNNKTSNGVTATRTNETTVTVSGTPNNDASIAIPNAELISVSAVTLNPSEAQTIDIDGVVAFTASIQPDGVLDKMVKWSVDGTNADAVTLYTDADCTAGNEVTLDTATETLTVYAKGIAAGSATVTVTSNADANKSASCDVTVNKANPTAPTGLTATYGQKLSDVALPTGWTWADSMQSVGNVGSNTFKADFAGNDNYNSASNVDVSVTVSAADPTTPTGLTATYGQTLADVTLPTGWTWADSTQSVGNVVDPAATFKANFAGNDNYKAASNVDVTVTVGKADPTAPTGLTATYGQTLANVTLPDGWTWADSTQSVGNVVDPAATFKANFAGDDNHNAASDVDVTVTVGKANAVAATVTANSRTYDGTEKPLVTVTGEATGGEMQYALGTATEATQPYTTSIPTGTKAGTYHVWYRVRGDANHGDLAAKSVKTTVAPREAKLSWKGTSFTYDGKSHAPTATVSNLAAGDKCSVTVAGAAKAAGSHTATATKLGNANYKLPAKATQAFAIAQREAKLAWKNTSFTYDGKSHVPTAAVGNLAAGDKCSVTVTGAAKAAGSHTATATKLSNANYKLPAKATQAFTIAKATPAKVKLTSIAEVAAKTYTGKAIKPTPAVKAGKATLKAGTDYTLSYKANVNAGTATVTAKGKGGYTGSVSTTFQISPAEITSIAEVAAQGYTGKAIKPKPAVKAGKRALEAGTDFSYSYKNNVKAGTATVTAKGKGNYAGTVKTTFKVVAPSCSDRAHVQGTGWQAWAKGGSAVIGTSGKGLRLEAIQLKLGKSFPVAGGIEYRAHVQTYGWEKAWAKDGATCGTTGQSRRLEAIQVRLTGQMAKKYDVYYRVHAQTYGWMAWAKNGAKAGTEGQAKRGEAVQIVLLPKGAKAPGTTYEGVKQQYAKAFV